MMITRMTVRRSCYDYRTTTGIERERGEYNRGCNNLIMMMRVKMMMITGMTVRRPLMLDLLELQSPVPASKESVSPSPLFCSVLYVVVGAPVASTCKQRSSEPKPTIL